MKEEEAYEVLVRDVIQRMLADSSWRLDAKPEEVYNILAKVDPPLLDYIARDTREYLLRLLKEKVKLITILL